MKNVFLCMLKLFLILINVEIFAIIPDLTAPFFSRPAPSCLAKTPTDSPVRLYFTTCMYFSIVDKLLPGGEGLNSFIARYNFSSNCIDFTFVVLLPSGLPLKTNSPGSSEEGFGRLRFQRFPSDPRAPWTLKPRKRNCRTSTVVVRSSHLSPLASPWWTEVSPKGAC